MGFWGVELYQNDTALDIKNNFEEMYNSGKSAQEITDKLMEDFKSIMGEPDEESLFWFALADTQWNFGVLLPIVKEQALGWIENYNMQNLTHQTDITNMHDDTRRILNNLKFKLLSHQPPVKKPVKKKVYRCQWKLGDVFAYQLESDLAKERELYGRYFLIQKIDEGVWHPGHIIPIVYVKITKDSNLPLDIEEYNQLEYIQTCFTRYEERFWPIDMSRPQEDIAEKSKVDYQIDEYGFLPQYRIALLNTSEKVIPSKLFYVGNFAQAIHPQNEYVPHSKINISPVFWKNFDETFETKMIKLYCGHNLRELSIYSNDND